MTANRRTVAIRKPSSKGGRGKAGIVRAGTKGIYDASKEVRAETARAMVGSREVREFDCPAVGCIDPATGAPRKYTSRVTKDGPEKKACSPSHRLRVWRKNMEDQGFVQRTVDGVTGWMTKDGTFFPNPTQSRRRTTVRRRRRSTTGKAGDSG